MDSWCSAEILIFGSPLTPCIHLSRLLAGGILKAKILASFVGFISLGLIQDVFGQQVIRREPIPGEIILAVEKEGLKGFLASGWNQLVDRNEYEPLLTTQNQEGKAIWLIQTKFNPGIPTENMGALIESEKGVIWASPNYRYIGDPREIESITRLKPIDPVDPRIQEQFHHGVMRNFDAWKRNGGETDIIVAVTDDGFELEHEDLKGQFWINSREIPDNQIDDDKNGYVDDVEGWDFASLNNDPRPQALAHKHGTHVAGIIGSGANTVGIVGTAPGVRIMPLQFFNYESWTSDKILKAYAYAADNGARIISTSYSIDSFVGDKVVESAIQYVYDKNVLHFNSAGNNSQYAPKRRKFTQLILVCSTIADNVSNDEMSPFSNHGPGIDLCAPGGGGAAGILSTIPNQKYDRLSGTSMATPNAAAVAALIWSQNPTLTRDQVAAQLAGTTDNIDQINSKFGGMLGSGRVNSSKALTEKPRPPTIQKASYGYVTEDYEDYNEVPTASDKAITISIHGVFDPMTMNDPQNWSWIGAGSDGLFGTGDDFRVPIRFKEPYRIGTNEWVAYPAFSLSPGLYRFYGKSEDAAGLKDPFGTSLDGNKDGIPGDSFVWEWEIR